MGGAARYAELLQYLAVQLVEATVGRIAYQKRKNCFKPRPYELHSFFIKAVQHHGQSELLSLVINQAQEHLLSFQKPMATLLAIPGDILASN